MLIIECEHIKLLLSKPKWSKYIPSFLKDMQIKYVKFSTMVPNIFEIEWEYYDHLTEEYILNPIPICDRNICYLFINKGNGNHTEMFALEKCINIM